LIVSLLVEGLVVVLLGLVVVVVGGGGSIGEVEGWLRWCGDWEEVVVVAYLE
jgi:hypothetical protein